MPAPVLGRNPLAAPAPSDARGALEAVRVRLGIYAHALAAEVELLHNLGARRDGEHLSVMLTHLRDLVRRMELRGRAVQP